MQAGRFVARWDVLIGDEPGSHLLASAPRGGHTGQVFRVGLLEEAAFVFCLSLRVVVLDREDAVFERSRRFAWIAVGMPAVGTIAPAASSGSGLLKYGPAGGA